MPGIGAGLPGVGVRAIARLPADLQRRRAGPPHGNARARINSASPRRPSAAASPRGFPLARRQPAARGRGRPLGQRRHARTLPLPGGEYTRERAAGGEQLFLGAFAEDAWKVTPLTHLTAAGRVDYYENLDGSRRETSLPTGPRRSTSISPTAGASWPTGAWVCRRKSRRRQRGCAPRSTRVSACRRSTSCTGPFAWETTSPRPTPPSSPSGCTARNSARRSQPLKRLHFSLTGYYNELDNPVANVTVAQRPG